MHISRRGFVTGSLAALGLAKPAAPAAVDPVQRVPAPSSDLTELGIRDAAALIRARRLSPVELTRALIGRIDAIEPKVHAFITVAREEAMEAARRAEQEIAAGNYRGPLHGIPFGVKDTHYTAGIRTTVGSPALADFVPTYDATVVARLKAAGAVLVGKLNLPEFSFGSATRSAAAASVSEALGTGLASNPWDLARTPGGSSSGSAIALAARMLPAATGGDTSGSIRNPSALCGVVGMKPTYGRVSRHGVAVISWSLDHVGPMTRTVEDNAILLNVLAGRDSKDETSSPAPVPDYVKALGRSIRGLRVGVPRSVARDGFDEGMRRAFEEATRMLAKGGARLVDVDLPPSTDQIDQVQPVIRIAEAAAYHEHFLATRGDRYGASTVKRDVQAGSLVTAVQYLRAQRVRRVFVAGMRELFRAIDVLITPGMPAPADVPATVRQNFRRMFNVCGYPALVLPSGFSTSPPGLPLSIQIAAAPFREETIYTVAHAYERETRWYERRPTL